MDRYSSLRRTQYKAGILNHSTDTSCEKLFMLLDVLGIFLRSKFSTHRTFRVKLLCVRDNIRIINLRHLHGNLLQLGHANKWVYLLPVSLC
jgi:hypothetical protein